VTWAQGAAPPSLGPSSSTAATPRVSGRLLGVGVRRACGPAARPRTSWTCLPDSRWRMGGGVRGASAEEGGRRVAVRNPCRNLRNEGASGVGAPDCRSIVKASKVRILHLPPRAERAPDQRKTPIRGPLSVLSWPHLGLARERPWESCGLLVSRISRPGAPAPARRRSTLRRALRRRAHGAGPAAPWPAPVRLPPSTCAGSGTSRGRVGSPSRCPTQQTRPAVSR